MELLGYELIGCVDQSSPERQLTRRAYEILSAFCVKGIAVLDYNDDDDSVVSDPALVREYDSVEVGPFLTPGREYSIGVDQIPYIDGEAVLEPGYVALHIAKASPDSQPNDSLEVEDEDPEGELDDDDLVQQQVVFRLETHPKGEAVFLGDYNNLEKVTDICDLEKIKRLLDFLTGVLWEIDITNRGSVLYQLPSPIAVGEIEDFLTNHDKS